MKITIELKIKAGSYKWGKKQQSS